MLRRVLLACGIGGSLLYVGVDVLSAIVYPSYHSFSTRWVSELMARGAPTERLVDPFFLAYAGLMVAFGVGLWLTDRRPRARVMSGLVIAYAALGMLGPTVFEMDVRGSPGAGPSTADFLHMAVTSVLVLIILAVVAIGATLRGRPFRLYSYATLATMVVFGALTSYMVKADGTPPWTRFSGVTERINIGAFLAWVVVLAVALYRELPGWHLTFPRPHGPTALPPLG